MKIISEGPLCNERSLHVLGDKEEAIMQCLHCGYVSSSKYIGDVDTNEEYKKLPENDKMVWGFSPMVTIPEEERKNYPDGNGGFFNKRYDSEKQVIYDSFFDVMIEINKKSSPKLSKE